MARSSGFGVFIKSAMSSYNLILILKMIGHLKLPICIYKIINLKSRPNISFFILGGHLYYIEAWSIISVSYRRGPTCGGYRDTSRPHRKPCSSSLEGCPWTVCCSRWGLACACGSGRRKPDRPWMTDGSSGRWRSCRELSCVDTRAADLPVMRDAFCV